MWCIANGAGARSVFNCICTNAGPVVAGNVVAIRPASVGLRGSGDVVKLGIRWAKKCKGQGFGVGTRFETFNKQLLSSTVVLMLLYLRRHAQPSASVSKVLTGEGRRASSRYLERFCCMAGV